MVFLTMLRSLDICRGLLRRPKMPNRFSPHVCTHLNSNRIRLFSLVPLVLMVYSILRAGAIVLWSCLHEDMHTWCLRHMCPLLRTTQIGGCQESKSFPLLHVPMLRLKQEGWLLFPEEFFPVFLPPEEGVNSRTRRPLSITYSRPFSFSFIRLICRD